MEVARAVLSLQRGAGALLPLQRGEEALLQVRAGALLLLRRGEGALLQVGARALLSLQRGAEAVAVQLLSLPLAGGLGRQAGRQEGEGQGVDGAMARDQTSCPCREMRISFCRSVAFGPDQQQQQKQCLWQWQVWSGTIVALATVVV